MTFHYSGKILTFYEFIGKITLCRLVKIFYLKIYRSYYCPSRYFYQEPLKAQEQLKDENTDEKKEKRSILVLTLRRLS